MERWISVVTEKRVLGTLAIRPDLWPSIAADFRPELFADVDHRRIAEILYRLAISGEGLSPTKLTVRLLRDGEQDADALVQSLIGATESVISTGEIVELVAWLRDSWQKRHVYAQLKAAAQEIAASDDDTPTEAILARAQDALVSAFVDRGQQEMRPWMDVITDLHAEWLEAQAGRVEIAHPPGLAGLSAAIGGLRTKRLYLLAGRPSMGKSALAMHMARTMATRDRHVLVCTLEQSATEFAQRAISAAIRLPADRWNHYPWDKEEQQQLNSGLGKVMGWPITMVDVRRPGVDKLKMLARVQKAQNPNLTMIIVDYLQEMNMPVGRGMNFATAVGDIASELRSLAAELDVVVILVSQLSRQVEHRTDQRPGMADLRDSGRLEEVADTVLLLYRAAYYKPTGMDATDNICEVIVAKNRQGGGAGKTALAYFDREYMTFRDVDEHERRQYLAAKP